jgi:uncharacterized Fe-S cluster protein YjdI
VVSEARHEAGVTRAYAGDGIVVHWEPALCIHAANCIRGAPEVFDPQARPWVKTSAAGADQIAEAIRSCPTGALTYRRTDRAPQEAPDVPTSVVPLTNGPLVVRGDVEIVGPGGEVLRNATRVVLCRCGYSNNKPYCDLSHRGAGLVST